MITTYNLGMTLDTLSDDNKKRVIAKFNSKPTDDILWKFIADEIPNAKEDIIHALFEIDDVVIIHYQDKDTAKYQETINTFDKTVQKISNIIKEDPAFSTVEKFDPTLVSTSALPTDPTSSVSLAVPSSIQTIDSNEILDKLQSTPKKQLDQLDQQHPDIELLTPLGRKYREDPEYRAKVQKCGREYPNELNDIIKFKSFNVFAKEEPGEKFKDKDTYESYTRHVMYVDFDYEKTVLEVGSLDNVLPKYFATIHDKEDCDFEIQKILNSNLICIKGGLRYHQDGRYDDKKYYQLAMREEHIVDIDVNKDYDEKDDIIYIHTDGFVSAQPLDESLIGDKL
eukprot:gene11274-3314_t